MTVDHAPARRVGLVLGAGGTGGLAFHAGVLLALHHDLGWDAREADIIVGTSAGSIVGTLLRAGVAPEDLAAWASDAAPTPAGRKFRALMKWADGLTPTARLPVPTLPGRSVLGVLAHPTQLRSALMTMLPNGLADQAPRFTVIDRLLERWPAKPLWIAAVRVGDGRLTWFGRHPEKEYAGPGVLVDVDAGPEPVRPGRAVAASCAIPVLSRPVRIGGHRYVDGGVRSPTNADVVAGHELDLVLVLSPMGHTAGSAGRSPARRSAHRRLQREVRVLRSRGLSVQVISPDAPTVKAMGWNMLERANTTAVMRAAFLGTPAQLHADVATGLRRRRQVSV